MGGLNQQINLYREDAPGGALARGTRPLLVAVVGACAILVTLAAVGELYLSKIEQERENVAAKLDAQRARLESFRATLKKPEIDPFLESELSALQSQQRRLNTSLAMISRAQDEGARDVSAFFAGLARNTIEGLWFSNVGLSAGGSEVLLKGKTLQPELVPRLLQILADEKAFAGRTFRKGSFKRSDQEDENSPVEFELRSAATDEVGDAG